MKVQWSTGVCLVASLLAASCTRQSVASLRPAPSHSYRWPNGAPDTIRVHIADAAGVAGWDATDHARVVAALRSWESTGIPLHFQIVAPTVPADLTINWVDQFRTYQSGWTTLVADRRGQIHRATVTLALYDGNGVALADSMRSAITLHELGHALGLKHVADSTALMWPIAGTRTKLTHTDVNAVRELYEPERRMGK